MAWKLSGLALMLAALLASWAASQEKAGKVLDERTQSAVGKAVEFLRKNPPMPFDAQDNEYLGAQALIGWTLLECGVKAGDAKIRALADEVRFGIIDCESHEATYAASLALIFLDKLADPV